MKVFELSRKPRYAKVKDEIVRMIRAHQLAPDTLLPSRSQMAERYDVSDITIRKAIGELENEGLVYSVKRRGTFVARPAVAAGRKTVAVILPNLERKLALPYSEGADIAVPLLQALVEAAWPAKVSLQVLVSGEDPALERRHLEELLEHPTDGLILMPAELGANSEQIRRLQEGRVRVVLVDHDLAALDATIVSTDHAAGAYLLARALRDEGFDDLHYFGSDTLSTAVRDRREGFLRAVARQGAVRDDRVHLIPYDISPIPSVRETARRVQELVEAAPGSPAFCAQNAFFALGIWRGIQAAKRPDLWARTALATFDRVTFPLEPGFRRWCAIQPFARIARASMEQIQLGTAPPEAGRRILFPPELLREVGTNRDSGRF